MCEKHGADIRLNTEATADTIVSLHPDVVILATGATPAGLSAPNDGIAVEQAVDILNGDIVAGKNVLVVGGGLIGLETASFLLSQMRTVTVTEPQHEVVEGFTTHVLVKNLVDSGVNIMKSTKVKRFTKDGAVCRTPEGEITLSGYDMVVLALSERQPYNPLEKELKGKIPEVYVIGDAKEARRIKDVVKEAAELATGI
jgi:pyruvate/2-oxoglutarate dehydrogenase complex dihydrolipoamide dehydrogenase (E3) component